MKLPATLRALQYRNFQYFFTGQLISLVGTWMQSVAEQWLVYRITGSAVLLGAMGFANQIPVFLFSPIGGIVADRYSRRHVVMATQAASMLLASVLATLTLTGAIRVWHLFVLTALLGVVNAFDIPARQAFTVDMVGKADLMNAIALNSSMFNASRMVGPAVAGILVAKIGEGWCFFTNAVSYIAVLAGLWLMKVPRREMAHQPGSPLARIVEGFRFVVHNSPVYTLLIMLGVLSLAGLPFSVLLPIFADRILHGGADTLGMLMGATGIGALLAALLMASRKDLRGLGTWASIASMAFSVVLVGFAYSRVFRWSMSGLVLLGFTMMIEMGATNTLIQSMVPDGLRGRVMAVYTMMVMGMAPIGSLLAGAVANRLGAPNTVAIGGVVCMMAAVIFAVRIRQIRVHARRLILAQREG